MGVRKNLLLAMVAVSAVPMRVPAQQGQPEERVSQFFGALEGQRWREAAHLIHPERLESFQDWQVSMLIGVARRHEQYRAAGIPPTPGYYSDVRFDPELKPDALAQYSNAPIGSLGTARTIGAAHAMPAAEFMERWLAARVQDTSSVDRRRFTHAPRQLVGSLIEADSLAHVLYRVPRPHLYTNDPADVDVMRLRKHEGLWYLWPERTNYDFWVGISPFLRLVLPGSESKRSQ